MKLTTWSRQFKTFEDTNLLHGTVSTKMYKLRNLEERKGFICDCCSNRSHSSIMSPMDSLKRKKAYNSMLKTTKGFQSSNLRSLISPKSSERVKSPSRILYTQENLNIQNKHQVVSKIVEGNIEGKIKHFKEHNEYLDERMKRILQWKPQKGVVNGQWANNETVFQNNTVFNPGNSLKIMI